MEQKLFWIIGFSNDSISFSKKKKKATIQFILIWSTYTKFWWLAMHKTKLQVKTETS